jgi:hypothetical protein
VEGRAWGIGAGFKIANRLYLRLLMSRMTRDGEGNVGVYIIVILQRKMVVGSCRTSMPNMRRFARAFLGLFANSMIILLLSHE